MWLLGIPMILFGISLITLTDIVLDNFSIQFPELSSLNERDSWIVNSTQTILELVKKQSLETKHSEGIAISGIGAGIMLSSILILFESWRNKKEYEKSQDFVRSDLEGINNKLVMAISLLKKAKLDLKSNNNIIKKILSGELSPLEIFSTMVTGLYFYLWESYASQLREFSKKQQQIINQLHGFILESKSIIEPSENSIILKLNDILESDLTNKSKEISRFLKPIIEHNLRSYGAIHKNLHLQLNKIPWIKNQEWKTIADVDEEINAN